MKDDWKTGGKQAAPSDHPLFTDLTYSTFELHRDWQFQFLKGVAHGIPQQYWSFAFRIAIKVAKELATAKIETISDVEMAHQKGYELPLAILRDMYKEIIGVESPV